jgi:hypothetical protein
VPCGLFSSSAELARKQTLSWTSTPHRISTDIDRRKTMAKKEKGYVEHLRHTEATRPKPWPGIAGRSKEHESELPTGTPREAQAEVTEAQRRLERDQDEEEKTRS